MPLEILVWLVAFILQSALLGISMYQLVQLTDLETDNTNPHDAAHAYNSVVLPEFCLQAFFTLVLLGSGHWVVAVLPAALLALSVRERQRGRHLADVTEIFREVAGRRRAGMGKLGANVAVFVVAIYSLIHAITMGLLSPEGLVAARAVLKEAAAALH